MTVWMGVYLDNNQTTNDRQLAHMYQLLDTYGSDPFEGIIIGNEVLFRQDLTATQLIGVINEVRQNLTSLNVNLKLATADLGSDWTAPLAQAVDVRYHGAIHQVNYIADVIFFLLNIPLGSHGECSPVSANV